MSEEEEIKPNHALRLLLALLTFAIPFVAAGTLDYWQAWTYVVAFTGACAWHTIYLIKYCPAVLKRRMKVGPSAETRPAQRIIISCVLVAFFVTLVLAGLDHRFGWSHLPAWAVILADVVLVLCFWLFNIVCRENEFAAATIEIADEQKVISTGPYALVRHPMYTGTVIFSLMVPLTLGSLWGVIVMLAVLPALILRIDDEENMLKSELPGYEDYCRQVRYRLLPGVY